mmetsp:Transcript_111845/g.256410  ORF Transcript_111845/g.256410 Transcript_111845/m.256410 type:complete len:401 (+) Transcript_111845:879-2081(+)
MPIAAAAAVLCLQVDLARMGENQDGRHFLVLAMGLMILGFAMRPECGHVAWGLTQDDLMVYAGEVVTAVPARRFIPNMGTPGRPYWHPRRPGSVGGAVLPAPVGKAGHIRTTAVRVSGKQGSSRPPDACSGTRSPISGRARRASAIDPLRPSEICIATSYTGRSRMLWLNRTLNNKVQYAAVHDHPLVVLNESFPLYHRLRRGGKRMEFVKVFLMAELLRNKACAYVFWTDADSIFLNFNRSLVDILDLHDPTQDSDMLIAVDADAPVKSPMAYAFNAGNWFVKNTDCALQLLDSIADRWPNDPYWCVGVLGGPDAEQCSLLEALHAIKGGINLRGRIGRIPFRGFNSLLANKFDCGDFLLHAPGTRSAAEADRLLQACPHAAGTFFARGGRWEDWDVWE